MFERYSRYEPEVAEALTQMFVSGTSTHKVGEVAATLMVVAPSASSVSRLNQTLTEQYKTWRKRPLLAHYRILYLDGIHFSVRHGTQTDSTIILTALGAAGIALSISSMPLACTLDNNFRSSLQFPQAIQSSALAGRVNSMPDSPQTLSESVNNATPLRISTLGHKGHGKTTLIAAITRVLANVDARNSYMTVDQLEHLLVEHQRSVPLTFAEVTHNIDNRQYIQIDYLSHIDSIKDLLTTSPYLSSWAHAFTGAILVVSATEGITPQVRDQVLLASKVEIPKIIVFLNKIDLVEDKDLLAVVELEIRELLNQHQFTIENSPIIRDSALQALTSQGDLSRQDPAAGCIWQLLDTLHTTLHPFVSPIDKPFLLPIEDVFSIKGRGTVVTGIVMRGQIKVGENAEIIGIEYKNRNMNTIIRETVVTHIDAYMKKLEKAQPGDPVGCTLSNVARDEVRRGYVLTTHRSIMPQRHFRGFVYIRTKEEGGRHTPFFQWLSPQNLDIHHKYLRYHYATTKH